MIWFFAAVVVISFGINYTLWKIQVKINKEFLKIIRHLGEVERIRE